MISDVCSSDLKCCGPATGPRRRCASPWRSARPCDSDRLRGDRRWRQCPAPLPDPRSDVDSSYPPYRSSAGSKPKPLPILQNTQNHAIAYSDLYENSIMLRSEEHTSELQSLMSIT